MQLGLRMCANCTIAIALLIMASLMLSSCTMVSYSLFGATETLPFHQKWIYKVKDKGDFVASKMLLGKDDTIFLITSDDGKELIKVYAIGSDGSEKWSTRIPGFGPETACALGPDNSVYVLGGSRSSQLIALSPNGKKKWSFEIGTSVDDNIGVTHDGTVLLSIGQLPASPDDTSEPKIIALNDKGKLKWEFTADSWFMSKPAIGKDGTIYFTGDKGLYALTSTGKLKWKYNELRGSGMTPTLAADGTIYVNSRGIYAINSDGTEKWKTELAGDFEPEHATAVAKDGTIYTLELHTIYALNANGKLKWKFSDFDGESCCGLVLDHNGTIYFSLHISNVEPNRIFALRPDGTIKWQRGADIVTDDVLIGKDGTKYVIDIETITAYSDN